MGTINLARGSPSIRQASLAETTQINFKSKHILRFDMFSNDVQSESP